MAKLYFHYGAMNGGKTIDLLRAAHGYEERGMSPFLIKPKTDTKAEDKVSSRIGIERKVDILVPPDMDIYETIVGSLGAVPIDCIFADEAQFFTPQQADQLHRLTLEPTYKPVMAYGLRSDFRTHGFPGSSRLLEIADVIREIRAICRCGGNATFNGRKLGDEFVLEGDQVAIDGKTEVGYESLCGQCFTDNVGSISSPAV